MGTKSKWPSLERWESASFESVCLVPFIGQPVMLSLGFGSSIPLETLSLQQMYLMMAATDTVKCPYTMVVLTRSLQVLQEKRTYPTCLGWLGWKQFHHDKSGGKRVSLGLSKQMEKAEKKNRSWQEPHSFHCYRGGGGMDGSASTWN